MRILFPKSRPHWLRSLLGALLTLHIGFAQASMVHGAMANAAAGSALGGAKATVDAPKCHGEMMAGQLPIADRGSLAVHSTSPINGHTPAHGPCCAAGDCNCAAGCYQSVAAIPALLGLAGRTIALPIEAHVAFPPQLARELRPPIKS